MHLIHEQRARMSKCPIARASTSWQPRRMPMSARRMCKTSARRRPVKSESPGSGRRVFQQEVEQCVSELHRMRTLLLARFSTPAVAASLAIHAVNALFGCVERDEITARHARALIERMAELRLALRDLRRP